MQTLAHNSTATLSVIKDYLVNKLQKQSCQIEQDGQRIQKYREETTRIRQEIEELKARCRTVISCLILEYYFLTKGKYTVFFFALLLPVTVSVPRSFRRPSVAFAPVPWSCPPSISYVVIPSTSIALKATPRAIQNVLLVCLKIAK